MKLKIVLFSIMFIFAFGLSHPAFAEKQVFAPDAEEGELELENTGVYDFDPNKDKNAVQEYHEAIGYGVNRFLAHGVRTGRRNSACGRLNHAVLCDPSGVGKYFPTGSQG